MARDRKILPQRENGLVDGVRQRVSGVRDAGLIPSVRQKAEKMTASLKDRAKGEGSGPILNIREGAGRPRRKGI